MRRANKFIVGGALFISTIASGCSDGAIEAKPGSSCNAVDVSGNVLSPNSYPTGKIDVEYQEARTTFNEVEHSEGNITEASGRYTLRLATLPLKLSNGYIEGFNNTEAVVVISSPDLGRIGLTASCVSRDVNEFGVPSVEVSLPTQS